MTTCPTCGEKFSALGKHWVWSDNCIVEIPREKMEILRGILMGDGWVGTSGRVIQAEWACEEYAEYISDELGWVCGDVKERENRNEIYQVNTISHRDIEDVFSPWYSSGSKIWDTSKPLTETAMRHLYACDGHLKVGENRTPAAVITCNNEEDRIESVADWVGNSGFPRPTVHNSSGGTCLYFTTDDTPELLSMIDTVDGYEYKWEL